MKKYFIAFFAALLLVASTAQADTEAIVVSDPVYVNNPDGSICCGTPTGELGNYHWDCWYPW